MRTVGVDLSAEARHTGIAVIDWRLGRAEVIDVRVGADDKAVLASMHAADKTALDCPLGWPEPFVEFLVAHRDGHVTVPVDVPGLAWRRTLSRRTTDLHVAALTGVTPLSVAADRIAAVAMRAAGLLSVLAQQGQSVDRAGAGQVVEVYPAAALKCWHLPFQTYKGPLHREALGRLVDALLEALPMLDLCDTEPLCRQSDDAFDAVICALVARAAAKGMTAGPPEHLTPLVASEGWIMLPTTPLARLTD